MQFQNIKEPAPFFVSRHPALKSFHFTFHISPLTSHRLQSALPRPKRQRNRPLRAVGAAEAADALGAAAPFFINFNRYGTLLYTFITFDAFIFVYGNAHHADAVKERIQSAQGAEGAAKGPFGQNHPGKKQRQDNQFDNKKRPRLLPQLVAERQQGDARLERSGWAELAEPGLTGYQGNRHNQNKQNGISCVAEGPGHAQLGRFYFIEHVLDEPERTGPAAHNPAARRPDCRDEAGYIKGDMIFAVFDKKLKATHGAAEQGRRAGVAVEARAGGKLKASLINIAQIKAVEIAVIQKQRSKLRQSLPDLHGVVLHNPDAAQADHNGIAHEHSRLFHGNARTQQEKSRA